MVENIYLKTQCHPERPGKLSNPNLRKGSITPVGREAASAAQKLILAAIAPRHRCADRGFGAGEGPKAVTWQYLDTERDLWEASSCKAANLFLRIILFLWETGSPTDYPIPRRKGY